MNVATSTILVPLQGGQTFAGGVRGEGVLLVPRANMNENTAQSSNVKFTFIFLLKQIQFVERVAIRTTAIFGGLVA